MDNRKQPIYDNKKLKEAGKYNFENVNAINKRSGEMQFDHTLKEEQPKKYTKIIVTSIISAILLIATCLIAFTDLKYLIFPEKKEIIEENFEDTNIIHEMNCTYSKNNEALRIDSEQSYTYNNAKIKTVKYIYVMEILTDELKNEEVFDYVETSFQDIIDKYKNEKGLKISYEKDGTKYTLKQEANLKDISSIEKQTELFNVYLDKNIDSVKKTNERNGFTCKQK